jgi:hypothetical protein
MSTDVRFESVEACYAAFVRQWAKWDGVSTVESVRGKWAGSSGTLVLNGSSGWVHVFRFLTV